MSLLCLALRPLLARPRIDGPAFTSIFQGATRWQTYVALSVSANLFGDVGLALASVAMVAIIPLVNVFSVAVLAHYASPEKQSARAIVMTVVRNPLIWACAIGLALNVTHFRCQKSGTRSPTRSAGPRSPSACSSPAPACSSRACSARAWRRRSRCSSSWC